jgi:hypothetical protein
VDDWREEFGDLGEEDETQMVRRMWPDGQQPVTARPRIMLINPDDRAHHPVEGGEVAGPAMAQLHTPTQGGSIAWTMDPPENGDATRWRLYTELIRLPAAQTTTLRARACRIGYKPSEETSATFTVS